MSSPYKLRINKWAVRHEVLIRLAIAAQEMAATAEWAFEMTRAWRDGKPSKSN